MDRMDNRKKTEAARWERRPDRTGGRASGLKRRPGRKAARMLLLAGGFAAILLLAGCGTGQTIDAHTPGFYNHYIVFPFSWLIERFAGWFGGSYGLALIAVTVAVRMALLPFTISQHKRQQLMKRKMSAMQPEIEAVKKKYSKSKDAESQRKLQQETMAVYSKHGYNPLSLGCLPMLLQISILTGLYYAIRMTPDLAQHQFLWFQLGSPDMIMPFLAAGVYLLQAKITQSANPPMPGQTAGMSWIVYLSPVMMGIFSFSAPAALPLYWCIGGLVVILQTLLAKRLYPAQEPAPAAEPAAG